MLFFYMYMEVIVEQAYFIDKLLQKESHSYKRLH